MFEFGSYHWKIRGHACRQEKIMPAISSKCETICRYSLGASLLQDCGHECI